MLPLERQSFKEQRSQKDVIYGTMFACALPFHPGVTFITGRDME
jgi:hypothetical protein